MSDFDSCKVARDIVSDMTFGHWKGYSLRARKFGSVGIEAATMPEPGEKVTDFGVVVGVVKGPVPPKCAPIIELALKEAELDLVPLRYVRTSEAIAH